jgi:hypothetical protein
MSILLPKKRSRTLHSVFKFYALSNDLEKRLSSIYYYLGIICAVLETWQMISFMVISSENLKNYSSANLLQRVVTVSRFDILLLELDEQISLAIICCTIFSATFFIKALTVVQIYSKIFFFREAAMIIATILSKILNFALFIPFFYFLSAVLITSMRDGLF